MFCGGDLPVSGLGYPRVSGPASSTRTCPLLPTWKAVPSCSSCDQALPDPAAIWQLAGFSQVLSR